MKRRFISTLALVLLFAVGNASAAADSGCVKTYMNQLELCVHMADDTASFVCQSDAMIEYVGCIRRALLF